MAELSEHVQPCPRCAVPGRRIAELERPLAAALARISGPEKRYAALEALLEQRLRDGGRRVGPDYGTQAFRTFPTDRPTKSST